MNNGPQGSVFQWSLDIKTLKSEREIQMYRKTYLKDPIWTRYNGADPALPHTDFPEKETKHT